MDPTMLIAFAHPRPTKGAPTHSAEALALWTPVLGPTAMLLAYRLAGDVERDGLTTYVIDALADDLGVAAGKVNSAVKRLGRYDVADVDGNEVAVRLTLPSPPRARQKNEPLTLSVPEAADLLGISRSMAYQGVHDGTIPAVTIGRRILVPRDRLMRMLAEPDD